MNRREALIINDATPMRHCLSGDAIGEMFADGAMGDDRILDYFIECLKDDDARIRPECVQYRIVIPSTVFVSLLTYPVIFDRLCDYFGHLLFSIF